MNPVNDHLDGTCGIDEGCVADLVWLPVKILLVELILILEMSLVL